MPYDLFHDVSSVMSSKLVYWIKKKFTRVNVLWTYAPIDQQPSYIRSSPSRGGSFFLGKVTTEGRKKEASKQDQTNNKAKQHSTPKAVTLPNKNELPRVGLEPTTLRTLDRALYHVYV